MYFKLSTKSILYIFLLLTHTPSTAPPHQLYNVSPSPPYHRGPLTRLQVDSFGRLPSFCHFVPIGLVLLSSFTRANAWRLSFARNHSQLFCWQTFLANAVVCDLSDAGAPQHREKKGGG